MHHRKLGFWETFCIASGAMISSGLFVLPGLAFAKAGPAMIAAYAMAGLFAVPALFCQVELATAMPRAGGSYLYVERSLGTFAGTFAGLAGWFAIALKAAFALIGIGAFARLVWPGVSETIIKLIAAGGCLFFTGLNLLSVRGVGRFQVLLVAVLLVILGVFLVSGLGADAMEPDHFRGFWNKGIWEISGTAGLVFVSFGGLLGVANIAGEVRRPGRILPLAMLSALGLVSVLYVACAMVIVGVTPTDALPGSLTPMSLAAGEILGPVGVVLLAVGAMLAYVTTANGGILEASRAPSAMSHDGLLPQWLGATRRGLPVWAVLLTGAFMLAVILALSIENLVKVASTMLLLLYILTCAAVIVMRSSRIQNYRPLFRTPLYPIIPLAGIGLYGFLIADMRWVPLLTAALFALAGLVWYLIYIRNRIERESALVYLVKNAVSREIYRSDLEEELKAIAIERDAIEQDRFDRLVKSAVVLDLPQRHTAEELFTTAAEELSGPLELDAGQLRAKFEQREADSSTILQPGLAVPHIIVEGRKRFELLLVRCREGVVFDERRPPVHTAFVLVGSKDQRNFHLRALMAIAHIVQEQGFFDRWFAATGQEQLRDVVLLSRRQRDTAESSGEGGT